MVNKQIIVREKKIWNHTNNSTSKISKNASKIIEELRIEQVSSGYDANNNNNQDR